MLLLDLDDTIFETKSMDPKIFKPAIMILEKYYEMNSGEDKAKQVVLDLWSNPVDIVFKRYNTPEFIRIQFHDKLNELDYKLEIKTFDDYPILKNLNHQKILVTTGYEKIQKAKIKALDIERDFAAIHIDDPANKTRNYKLGIFREILNDSSEKAEEIWVIGDNAESEIKAGKALGMKTIQRIMPGTKKSELADFSIHSFKDLSNIL